MNRLRKTAALLIAFAMGCTAVPEAAFAVSQTEQIMEETQAETAKPGIKKAKAKELNTSVQEPKTVKSNAKAAETEKPDIHTEEAVKPSVKRAEPKENTEKRNSEKGTDEIESTGTYHWIDLDLSMIEEVMQADSIYPVWITEETEPYLVYLFTPERSGYYTFFSEGPYDTYGMIGDEDGYLVAENDDRDSENYDYNFAVSAFLDAGTAYYCVAQMYDSAETGYYHCAISSSKTSYHLNESDIQKFEITDFPTQHFYKPKSDVSDMPFEDCEYCITFTDGQTMYGYLSSNILGLSADVRFKYPLEGDSGAADTSRDDNALIYSIAGIDAEEIPITFEESPIEALELVTMPNITTVAQIYADDIIDYMDGLSIRIRYTDQSENMMCWDEDGYYMENEDQIDAYPTWEWKMYDYIEGMVMTGKNAIIISYLDQSVEIPITVQDSSVQSISIVRNPSKMYYGIYEDVVDLYGLVLRIVYGDGSSEQVTITEHGAVSSIGKYQLNVRGIFLVDDDDFVTGDIAVVCEDCVVYYKMTFQTYADLRKEAVQLLPGQITRVSLNQNTVYRVFRFVPLDTGSYQFYSLGNCDTYLDVVGSDGSLLASKDDGGMDGNFQIDCRLTAGRTYYFVVSMLRTGETGNFACKLAGASAYSITYNLNGGTNNSANPAFHYNQTILLQNPTRPQYTFDGWYKDSRFRYRITQITAGSRENYVLYAKWTKVSKPGKVKLTSASNSKAKKISVKYKKVKNVAGYEIAYSTNKKFKKASTITARKTKATIGKLKKGKTYYVRVCAYNLDSTGQKIRGKWSASKKVTVKK